MTGLDGLFEHPIERVMPVLLVIEDQNPRLGGSHLNLSVNRPKLIHSAYRPYRYRHSFGARCSGTYGCMRRPASRIQSSVFEALMRIRCWLRSQVTGADL